MFRDDRQKAAVCNVLTNWIWKGDFWDEDTPKATSLTIETAKRDGDTMSSGEHRMFLLAWELWTGEPALQLDEIIRGFTPNQLRQVGSLLMAIADGADEIDNWLSAWGQQIHQRFRNFSDKRLPQFPTLLEAQFAHPLFSTGLQAQMRHCALPYFDLCFTFFFI